MKYTRLWLLTLITRAPTLIILGVLCSPRMAKTVIETNHILIYSFIEQQLGQQCAFSRRHSLNTFNWWECHMMTPLLSFGIHRYYTQKDLDYAFAFNRLAIARNTVPLLNSTSFFISLCFNSFTNLILPISDADSQSR